MSIPSSSASVETTPSSSPADQPALELAPLLRRVAGAVGRDPLRQLAAPGSSSASWAKRAISSTALRDFMNTIVRAPWLTSSASRSAASASAERRVASCSSTIGGFHIAIVLRAPGRAVAVDRPCTSSQPGQALGELARVGDRGAGEQEARLGPVGGGDPPQPPQHVGHVRAEHAAVDVRLVDDDDARGWRTSRAHARWFGRIPRCSMSGFVRTTLARRRICARCSRGVSPS